MAQPSGAPGNDGQVEAVPPMQASNEAGSRLDTGLVESRQTPPGHLDKSASKDLEKSWIMSVAPFRTPPHAFVAFLGLAGIACLTIAIVFKHPFDACVAAALLLLCGYVFSLQTERYHLESMRQEPPKLSEVLSTDGPTDADIAPAGARTGPSASSGTSELDLTGYAKTLGVSMRGGGPTGGSTLNKILMNALAKEYLRCVSALRCYQSTFGPLEDSANAAASISGALDVSSFLDVQAMGPCANRPDSLQLQVDTTNAEQTPRSPGGPPSPEEKRRRAYSSGFQEIGQTPQTQPQMQPQAQPQTQDTPDFHKRGSPEEQCTVRSIGTALQNAASSFSGACSSADASPGVEAGAQKQQAASSAESTVTPSFSASPEKPAAVSETPPAPRTTTRYYDTPTSPAGPAEPGLEAGATQAEQPPPSSFGLFR